MSNTITSTPTLAHVNALAERQAKAATASSDAAALAAAEWCRQLRGNVYQLIAANRHGVVREEVVQAFPVGELVDTILAALIADHEVVERGGVFSVPQVAA